MWPPSVPPTLICPRYAVLVSCHRELAIQLRRDVLPVLDEQGVKLYLVSIGTWERSKQFVEVTDFPPERLLVDPDNVTYTALGLAKGVMKTFFSAEVSVTGYASKTGKL